MALLFVLLLASAGFLPAAEDFVITVNGVTREIGLEREATLVLADGTRLCLRLSLKDVLRFAADFFFFEHKSAFKPNRKALAGGVFQTMVVSASGTGILIQEYTRLDPSGLVDTMLKALSQEEVASGYTYREKAVQRQAGAVTLRGKQAVTTTTGEEWTREVLAYGENGKGVLVVTFIEKEEYENAAERELIDRLWSSLEIGIQ